MKKQVVSIKIAGMAGAGIKVSGQLLAKMLVAHGLYVIDYSEYPSLVRGGHNTYQVSFSNKEIKAVYGKVDLLFSLGKGHGKQHIDEVNKDGQIFSEDNLPLDKGIYNNTFILGVASEILELDSGKCTKVLGEQFGDEENKKIFNEGREYSQDKKFKKIKIKLTVNKNRKIYDGNEAFGWGFLRGGGNFYAAYPMTPATGTLHFLAQMAEKYKIKVIHPEDEISASNMVAGAAVAGARAATGTSGGGFALMNETVSFCSVAEIGAVFYLVSRPGPATGMPTWTSQGDLLHAINSGHGEFPIIVLAPGDQKESFEFGIEALNLAAELQMPIMVLSDKIISEGSKSEKDFEKEKVKIEYGKILNKLSKDFKRYSLATKTGVSPLTMPGTQGGEFLANSYEHDEEGIATEETKMVNKMVEKRFKKMKTALSLIPKYKLFSKKSKNLIISWGSTKGVVLETIENFNLDFDYLQIRTVWPINKKIEKIVNKYKKIIVVENNATSQLTTLLKSQFDFNPDKLVLKADGRPFFPEELVKKI